jgi:RNA polymerase sigma-70 factor (ECF subfamily)
MLRALQKPSRAATIGRPARLSDDALIEALARGDRELAGELCRRLKRVVGSTLYRVLGQRDADYDDLVQASFEQIFASLGRGNFARGSTFSTWASAVTCNVALKAIARRKRERGLFDASGDLEAIANQRPDSANPEAQIGARRHLQRLHAHLSRMSTKLAETLVLHDILGFGLGETASLTGASQAAVRSRLARGRRNLSHRLRDEPLLR